MRILFTCFILLGTITSWAQTADSSYVQGKIYLKFKEGTSLPNAVDSLTEKNPALPFIQAAVGAIPLKSTERPFATSGSLDAQQVYVVELDQPAQVNELITQLTNNPTVEYAERIPILRAHYIPNDTYYSGYQYSLGKINAEAAWDITKGSSSIIVGVIDSGVETSHEDLAGNLVQGRDVAEGDDNPNPDNANYYHGSHVAGIVSAKTDNGIGVASLGFNVKVMPIKAAKAGQTSSSISFYDTDVANAIYWAADHGVRVINMSLGGTGSSTPQQNAVNYATGKGCVIVASAGNANTDVRNYPAAYTNVISVASTTSSDTKSDFSTYGTWVDISAPGSSINSTLLGNTYGGLSGTSMASPLVASLAGLMLSVNPTMTPAQVETVLKISANNIDNQNPSYVGQLGSGRINAYNAVMRTETIYSTTSGSWPTAGVWTYQAPSLYTNPSIQAGHTITVPGATYQLKNALDINGILDLSTSNSIIDFKDN